MEAILTTIERLSGRTPGILLHAPFPHSLNLTPYASLSPSQPYDLTLCAGQNVALFATQDKTETLGLWASAVQNGAAALTVVWPNDWGGKSMRRHLDQLNVAAIEEAKHKARIAFMPHPAAGPHWHEAAMPKLVPGTGLSAEAGLFSHRQVDDGSALLAAHLPHDLAGDVADFGCGWGYLSERVLHFCPNVASLTAIDNDARAAMRTKTNIRDARLKTIHADITARHFGLFDTIVMNPPFHRHGQESKLLGLNFIVKAAESLKHGGTLYMVANRHLPYERELKSLFASGTVLADEKGFKVIKAVKGA